MCLHTIKAKFMVMNMNSNNRPTYEHHTKEAAIMEARRLADGSQPGTRFIILQQIGVVEKTTTTYTEFDLPDDNNDIPF